MKPRHTQPDANQKQIEDALQQIGFWTYRTADCPIQVQRITQERFHPLDLLVIGYNVRKDCIDITLWEIKSSDTAPFTSGEEMFLDAIQRWWNGVNIPVRVAYSLEDILQYYGRLTQ